MASGELGHLVSPQTHNQGWRAPLMVLTANDLDCITTSPPGPAAGAMGCRVCWVFCLVFVFVFVLIGSGLSFPFLKIGNNLLIFIDFFFPFKQTIV